MRTHTLRSWPILILNSLMLFSLEGCGNFFALKDKESAPTDMSTFKTLSESIIQPKCGRCHSASSAAGGISLDSYQAIMGSGTVVPFKADKSRLYLASLSGSMPKGATRLQEAELNAISTWINAGALAEDQLFLTGVSPGFGPKEGGTVITLSGGGFRSGVDVSIDGYQCDAVKLVSKTSITCVTPAHEPGPVDIEVFNPTGEEVVLVNGFNYTGAAALISFADLNLTVIQPHCVGCHNASPSGPYQGMLKDFSSYAALRASNTVMAGNPAASSFYSRVAANQMPVGSSLSSAQKEMIFNWILLGAGNN